MERLLTRNPKSEDSDMGISWETKINPKRQKNK
nr:MAG TPA: hypothetical protein [Caudoviricetes sp.]